jgi:enoyl-CoA hydratase
MDNELKYECTDGIVVITINRPEARNAISLSLAQEISNAMDRFDSDPEALVGIITGTAKFFSAGMDLKGFSRGELPIIEGKGFAGFVERPPTKPLIAAVEGFALAGGFEMALACDLIVAAENATFGLPEVTRGIVASAGGLLKLPRQIPHHIAMELILTGAHWPALEAHRYGLVNQLSAEGSALEGAQRLAAQIAQNAPLALVASKAIVNQSVDWPASEAFERQFELVDPIRKSADAQEGSLAFIEKRPPRWTGK